MKRWRGKKSSENEMVYFSLFSLLRNRKGEIEKKLHLKFQEATANRMKDIEKVSHRGGGGKILKMVAAF